MRFILLFPPVLLATAHAADFHVAAGGDDANAGTRAAPFRTIQHAAALAQPGDVITVNEGVYRERVSPPRGGASDARRIVYQAAAGAKVEIKGSEVMKDWVKVQDDVWKATLPNAFFGGFNPYSDLIHGDWFYARNRQHHTGAVYLNGGWLVEAATLGEVLDPAGKPLWFAQVDKDNTTILARFKGVNPNEQRVEINVRQAVFYPEKPGMNFITVRGFLMSHAATPWAPPTAEQVGLIGTHWSKGWIIENNVISHSMCTGITLGKYGDEWDNKSADSAEGYVKTIERALRNGWNKETIGHHIVRNNTISHCGQSGIVGSLGAVFSSVTGNTIHDIHAHRPYDGCEQAGIKFHAAIDVEIRGNHIYQAYRGLWLDWMAQGTRVSGNLLHDNDLEDFFAEVNHGPLLVDNNIFLSPVTLNSRTQGAAYVHNLMAGKILPVAHDDRMTPFHKPHSTELAGLHDNPCGDDRYYNNIMVEPGGLGKYDEVKLKFPVAMGGNVFLKGAKPSKHETAPVLKPQSDPAVQLITKSDGLYLEMTFDKELSDGQSRKMVTTDLLGKAVIPNVPFEQPDGSPWKIDSDYAGRKRDPANPSAGPFENPGTGRQSIKVW
jgi:alpha-N-arabinofuranosidase